MNGTTSGIVIVAGAMLLGAGSALSTAVASGGEEAVGFGLDYRPAIDERPRNDFNNVVIDNRGSGEVGGVVSFFTNPADFEEALSAAGKVSKAQWDFDPQNLAPATVSFGTSVPLLDITTHPVNMVPDPWTDDMGNVLWPTEVDNVQFGANLTPPTPFTPNPDPISLVFATPGAVPDVLNNTLLSNFFADSFDIVSGPPAGDNHTAIGLEITGIAFAEAGTVPLVFTVTVYDKDEVEVGRIDLQGFNGIKNFLGILRNDGETIGRVDIQEQGGSTVVEGISSIALYQNAGDCPWDLSGNSNVGTEDLIMLLANWGNPYNFADLLALLASWGPCPGPVVFYEGMSMISTVIGQATFDGLVNGDPLQNYMESGLTLDVDDFEFAFQACGMPGGSVPSYYPNGGTNTVDTIVRTDGQDFDALEMLVSHGFAGCNIFVWIQAYLDGALVDEADIDTQGGTLLGCKGTFDELRIASYMDAATRDAHDPAAMNAIAIDNVTYGDQ